MCFSTSASFGAGIVLSIIGIATIKKTQRPEQVAFAAIPLIFAVQQFSEGFLWMALQNPNAVLTSYSTYTFIFFAQLVWPVWVPWSIMILERREDRRISQKILLSISIIVTIYLAWCLMVFDVNAQIKAYHIKYVLDYPKTFGKIGIMLYAIITIVPPYFSRVRGMWVLATIILISYIITFIFYREYLLSVWCFFSALISIVIYFIIGGMDKTNRSRFNVFKSKKDESKSGPLFFHRFYPSGE